MIGRVTPEWYAWARQQVALERERLASMYSPAELAQRAEDHEKQMDAHWAKLAKDHVDAARENVAAEQATLASLGPDGIRYLTKLKKQDYEDFDPWA